MIRAVLFDAAGTLIELREPVGETYARLARGHDFHASAWRVGDAFRRALAAAGDMVFPDAPAAQVPALEREWWRGVVRATFRAADSAQPLRDFDSLFERLWRHFSGAEAWSARAGAAELLARLRAGGMRIGVVSNFDSRLPGILAALGLLPLVDAVVIPADARAAKPDPRAFARALALLGVAAAEAVFVGDDAQRDLEAARAAGLRAIDAGAPATLADLQLPAGAEP